MHPQYIFDRLFYLCRLISKVEVNIKMTRVIYKNALYVYLHVDLALLTMPMIYV